MSDLHDVVVDSSTGTHRYIQAMHAEIEELRGRITLIRDVHVLHAPVQEEEYTITSKDPLRTMRARYVGPDHAVPGALIFDMIPRARGRNP
jgi:hypothetical protein